MPADRLLLLRHGRTAFNLADRFQGHTDVPLDDVGRAQAEAAATAVAALVTAMAAGGPVALASSDLSRAWDTAVPLARLLGVEVEPEKGLREVFAGEWEGLPADEILWRWPVEYTAWRAGEDVAAGGGETRTELAARASASLVSRADAMEGGVLVAVGHGGSIRAGVVSLVGLPAGARLRGPGNARWAVLDAGRAGWGLRMWNAGLPEMS